MLAVVTIAHTKFSIINGVAGSNRKSDLLFRQWQRGALSLNSVINMIILQIIEKNADPEMTLLVYLRRHCKGLT